jgi:transposase
MYPTPSQAEQLAGYCGHARYVWNLAVEQLNYSSRRKRDMPGFAEQSRQLTQARHDNPWMGDIPTVVGQQALRDFRQACANWWNGTHKSPTWRKKAVNEGFRITDGHGIRVEQINKRWSRVWVPRCGWVKFRRTRAVPDAKSFRVTLDPSGRWHVAFAVIPTTVDGPGDQSVIGVDLGVTVTLAYSDGTMLNAPKPTSTRLAAKAVSRCKMGSNRRRKAKTRLARVRARNVDRRKDFLEKASTNLARRADLIRVEDLKIGNMTKSAKGTVEKPGRNVRAKSGLNRSILSQGWGLFVARLQDKAPGRVEKVNPAYTSQCCSSCGHIAAESRKSQALFVCVACRFSCNADVNAARNIAVGRTVRGAEKSSASKRVPQHACA